MKRFLPRWFIEVLELWEEAYKQHPLRIEAMNRKYMEVK